MRAIWQFESYKEMVKSLIDNSSDQSVSYKKLAEFLRVHPTLVSQVLKGDRDFSMEQAYDLCDFFKFSKVEKSYLLKLVEWERAGTHQLKSFLHRELGELKKELKRLEVQLDVDKQLAENEQAIYYSDASYAKVRMLISLEKYSIEQIAKKLRLQEATVDGIVEFLLQAGLVTKNGKTLQIGSTRTHLSKEGPYLRNHHRNWRLQSIESQSHHKEQNMFYTGVLSLSETHYEVVKGKLESYLKEIYSELKETEAETVACLNIDFFKW